MSANNHDQGDPNNVKYAKQNHLTQSELNKGRLIKIYSMAYSKSLQEFMKLMEEEYSLTPNQ